MLTLSDAVLKIFICFLYKIWISNILIEDKQVVFSHLLLLFQIIADLKRAQNLNLFSFLPLCLRLSSSVFTLASAIKCNLVSRTISFTRAWSFRNYPYSLLSSLALLQIFNFSCPFRLNFLVDSHLWILSSYPLVCCTTVSFFCHAASYASSDYNEVQWQFNNSLCPLGAVYLQEINSINRLLCHQ